jgi:molybdopterin synthase catalytic subunit
MTRVLVRIQKEDFDHAQEIAALTQGRTDIGAVASFVGLCRDEGGRLTALELEHYPGMAEEEITRICDAATRRWPLLGVSAIHRVGRIVPGENIVLVITVSVHREAAFRSAEFIMDFLKSRAPFWKKEHARTGATHHWVEAKESDDRALEKW